MTRYRLEFDTGEPDSVEIGEIVEAIAANVMSGDTDGDLAHSGMDEPCPWRLEEVIPGVEIDRRQRQAAAILLMAFDLPQELNAAAAQMLEAARVCPGLHTGEMPDMQSRKRGLTAARELIEAMLAEIA